MKSLETDERFKQIEYRMVIRLNNLDSPSPKTCLCLILFEPSCSEYDF